MKHVELDTLPGGQTIWTITYLDLASKLETTKTYDAVVLCNGHYTVGNIPRITGSETFAGDCIHSHQYRKPEKYTGKKVCILGASWSGIDIAMEVSQYAEKVRIFRSATEIIGSSPARTFGVKSRDLWIWDSMTALKNHYNKRTTKSRSFLISQVIRRYPIYNLADFFGDRSAAGSQIRPQSDERIFDSYNKYLYTLQWYI